MTSVLLLAAAVHLAFPVETVKGPPVVDGPVVVTEPRHDGATISLEVKALTPVVVVGQPIHLRAVLKADRRTELPLSLCQGDDLKYAAEIWREGPDGRVRYLDGPLQTHCDLSIMGGKPKRGGRCVSEIVLTNGWTQASADGLAYLPSDAAPQAGLYTFTVKHAGVLSNAVQIRVAAPAGDDARESRRPAR